MSILIPLIVPVNAVFPDVEVIFCVHVSRVPILVKLSASIFVPITVCPAVIDLEV